MRRVISLDKMITTIGELVGVSSRPKVSVPALALRQRGPIDIPDGFDAYRRISVIRYSAVRAFTFLRVSRPRISVRVRQVRRISGFTVASRQESNYSTGRDTVYDTYTATDRC